MNISFLSGSQQTTIADSVSLHGKGVHSGEPVSVTLLPAKVDTGILVQRQNTGMEVAVDWSEVTSTTLCTVLGNPATNGVSTVEHLMAAFRGLEIDNVIVEIDAPEVPIMDGSSAPFVEAIDQVGVRRQMAERKFIRILKPVHFQQGDRYAALEPCDTTRYDITIEFDSPVIGRQNFKFDLTPNVFRNQIARARTFGFFSEVNALWEKGFQLGSSMDNSVVIDDGKVLNPEGTRWPDEFVRHKALDAIGDLALAGMPIQGMYKSYKGGHSINLEIVKKLFEDSSAYEIVESTILPENSQFDIQSRISAAAY